jgi:cupin fold WbuC family metalloprotein
MASMRQLNEEVFYSDETIVKINQENIQWLKNKALANARNRSRLCAHKDINALVHEMLIIHARDAYVRPHKHIGKSESFHVVEGEADIIIFNQQGDIKEVVSMGDYSSGKNFYYRITDALYHTVMITSEILVFHESTNGPFVRSDTIFAPWSPEEDDHAMAKEFMNKLEKQTKEI